MRRRTAFPPLSLHPVGTELPLLAERPPTVQPNRTVGR